MGTRVGPHVKVDWSCCGISELRFAPCSTPVPLLTWSWSCTPRSSRGTHVSTTNPLSLSLSNYNFMPSFTAITNTTKLHLLPPQVCEIETSPWIVFSTYLTCIYSYKNRNDKQRTFSILEFYWFFIGFYGVRIESSSVFKTILPSHFHYSFIYL